MKIDNKRNSKTKGRMTFMIYMKIGIDVKYTYGYKTWSPILICIFKFELC